MRSATQTPATFTSDPSAGAAAWATPASALASDDTYTVSSVDGLGSSQRLRGLGPAFAGIPAGSSIVGIEVLVEASADFSGGAVFEFAEVALVVAGSVAGSNRGGAAMQDGGDSDIAYTFGGASDLWSLAPHWPRCRPPTSGAWCGSRRPAAGPSWRRSASTTSRCVCTTHSRAG